MNATIQVTQTAPPTIELRCRGQVYEAHYLTEDDAGKALQMVLDAAINVLGDRSISLVLSSSV